MFVDEKAVGEAQTAEQKNRQWKLSEAIRAGAGLRPQCRGQYFSSGASCALGAALLPITEDRDAMLLRYMGIDAVKLENERRALLAATQSTKQDAST